MPTSDFRRLLESNLPPEPFVRQALDLLQAQTRELALLALGEWEQLELPRYGNLLPALASMEEPTWGTWNGLLQSLLAAREQVLSSGAANERMRVERAAGLAEILTFWEGALPIAAGQSDPSRFCEMIAVAIDLANRLAYGSAPEAAWWPAAAARLKIVVDALATDPLANIRAHVPRRAPWFVEEAGKVWSYRARAPDFSAIYVGPQGAVRAPGAQAPDLAPALGRLLGIPHERELRRLLSRHAPEDVRGILLGDFLVGRPVGEGGFGSVHLGRQLSTGRKVAIKLLHDGMPPDIKARFAREAGYLARFNHAHIVNVLAHGEGPWSVSPLMDLSGQEWFGDFAGSAPVKTYIAMEWVEGRTLEAVFEEAHKEAAKRPAVSVLAAWFEQSASALASVHAAGLVHRDVKPGNLMVTEDGAVKLMDFGIARAQEQGGSATLVTTAGRVFGTITYMSPEQIRAAESESQVGPSTDIYSLCATFYELFTLTRLYEHDAQSAEMVKTLKLTGQRPQPPRKQMRDLPWEIEAILLGGLEAEVADRYRSMESLQRDLRHFLHDEPIEYRRPTLPRRVRLAYRRNRPVANVLAASLLITILGTGFYIHSMHQEQARTLVQKELAEHNARESRNRLAASYEEQGRQELLAGAPLRASVYLSEAYSLGRATPATRFLLAQALRAVPTRIVTPQGHTRGVDWAQYNADGSQVVTAGRDGLVKLWDAATGRLLHTFELASSVEVTSASFSPDGTRLLAVGGGARAAVWDIASHRRLFDLIGHQGQRRINTAGYSPDGMRIVTACDDATACIWNAVDGHRLFVLPHKDPVLCAFFSPDGNTIVTGAAGYSAILWDAHTGASLHSLSGTGRPTWAAFSADGRQVVVAANNSWTPITLWDAATGKSCGTFGNTLKDGPVGQCALSPDGAKIVVWGKDAVPRLWDVASHDAIILNEGAETLDAAFSHDGRCLVTARGDGTITLWDVATGRFLRRFTGHANGVHHVAFSPHDDRILSASEDTTVRIWDAASGKSLLTLDGRTDAPNTSPLLRTISGTAPVHTVTFSRDGRLMLWTGFTADACNTATGKLVMEDNLPYPKTAFFDSDARRFVTVQQSSMALDDIPTGRNWKVDFTDVGGHDLKWAEFSPDGKQIVVAGTGSAWIVDVAALTRIDTAHIWILQAGALKNLLTLHHSAHGEDVVQARFSPDGTWVVTAGGDGTAKVWQSSSGALKATLSQEGAVNCAVFSPDSQTVLTAGDDTTAVLWDPATQRKLQVFKGHNDTIRTAVFTPEGQRIVTASRDGTAKVWDVHTGALLVSLEGRSSALTSAAVSADGAFVLTADTDGRAIIRDIAAGKQLTIFSGNNSAVLCAQFSPDGSRIITGSADGTVEIWDTHLETRKPEQVAELVRSASPWRLEGGRLVPIHLNPDPVEPSAVKP